MPVNMAEDLEAFILPSEVFFKLLSFQSDIV